MIKLWQGVAMRTGRDSQAGSIPTCHIVQFSDRTQLAMTPSDTGEQAGWLTEEIERVQVPPATLLPIL
ncbi:hypothetical protein [Lacticaseibacillus paracasei]|nr:hypothetical protein [Lacticaseibacillus paracasei]